jgi:hypothetical protein
MSEDFQDPKEELVDLKIEGESKNVKLEQDEVVEEQQQEVVAAKSEEEGEQGSAQANDRVGTSAWARLGA